MSLAPKDKEAFQVVGGDKKTRDLLEQKMAKAVGEMIQVEQIEMVLTFKYPGEDVVRMMCSAGGRNLAKYLQENWGANVRLFQQAATSSSSNRNISDVVSFLKGLKKEGLDSLFKKVFLEEGNTNNNSSNNPFHLKHGWNAAFQEAQLKEGNWHKPLPEWFVTGTTRHMFEDEQWASVVSVPRKQHLKLWSIKEKLVSSTSCLLYCIMYVLRGMNAMCLTFPSLVLWYAVPVHACRKREPRFCLPVCEMVMVAGDGSELLKICVHVRRCIPIAILDCAWNRRGTTFTTSLRSTGRH